MRYPSFIAEMALPENRSRLWFSVTSGYVLAFAFIALAVAADLAHVVRFSSSFYALLAFKLTTNTLALFAIRRNRFLLEATGVNVFADMLAMTGAIYLTGGELSPLFPVYAIEITVVALLSNVGLTVISTGIVLALYTTMTLLVHNGVLESHPPPVVTSGGITSSYVAIDLVYAFFVLAVPTFFTARILAKLREKQRALEARTAALIEAGKQKSQFMANVTHELRTPIHGICGLSDLVEGGIYGPVTDKQREATRGIKRSAKSLLQLIDDLLELARADAGKLAFKPEDVDVRELVEQVVASVRWMQGTKDLAIAIALDDDLPKVFTDPRKLGQIVLNLLSNAVKFTPEGGKIVVRARRHADDAVAIDVEDSGIGIAVAEQARIFEEFRQVDGSAERRFGGIGLGLALVKRLADAMQATIALRSEEGRGSTFTVVVPVRVAMKEDETTQLSA